LEAPSRAGGLQLNPSLAAALSSVFPTPEETSLLTACLATGEAAKQAWADWRLRASELKELLRGEGADVRRLAPLLLEGLRREQDPIEKPLLTVLRMAYHREELRSKEYRHIARTVLDYLAEAGIPLIVFRGAALGETVYGNPVLRHSHDLNLLLPPADQEKAVRVLVARGFMPVGGAPAPDAVTLQHRSLLPILVHNQLFRVSYCHLSWTELWERSIDGVVADRPVRLLSPEDTLLHTCSQATLRPGRLPLVWACDALLILRHYPELDWTVFLGGAQRSRTQLPAYIALRYLAESLQCVIPAPVLERLGTAVMRLDPVERDVALLAVVQREGLRLGDILRTTPSWRAKLTQVRWLLLPSSGYVRWAYGVRQPLILPLCYVRRLLRYVGYRLRQAVTPVTTRRGLRRQEVSRSASGDVAAQQ
jgi:hypothetical protein